MPDSKHELDERMEKIDDIKDLKHFIGELKFIVGFSRQDAAFCT